MHPNKVISKYSLWLILSFTVSPLLTSAQIKEKIQHKLAQKDSIKQVKIESGKPYLSLMIGPGYTPENGVLIGGGALYTFSTNPQNKSLQRSSIPIKAFYSSKGNFGASSKISTFWRHDKLRGLLNINFENLNDDYFGVGYETNENIPQSDTTSAYHRQSYYFNPEIRFKVLPNTYLGIEYTHRNDNITEVNPVMAQDESYLKYGNKFISNGAGGGISIDTRDLTVNAWEGFFIEFKGMAFGDYLASDNRFHVFSFDGRYYRTVQREGSVIALRFQARDAQGDVPYTQLSLLGGGQGLRGYIFGQYRDHSMVSLTGEWRLTFLDQGGDLSRNGMALWVASGSVAPSLAEIKDWLPNFGLGYRYAIQPRMNLRIDFGIGRHTSGLYFGINEVF